MLSVSLSIVIKGNVILNYSIGTTILRIIFMRLIDIIIGSEQDLSLFSEEKIGEFVPSGVKHFSYFC